MASDTFTFDARDCMKHSTITVRLRGLRRFKIGVWLGIKAIGFGIWLTGANYCFLDHCGDEQSSPDG